MNVKLTNKDIFYLKVFVGLLILSIALFLWNSSIDNTQYQSNVKPLVNPTPKQYYSPTYTSLDMSLNSGIFQLTLFAIPIIAIIALMLLSVWLLNMFRVDYER